MRSLTSGSVARPRLPVQQGRPLGLELPLAPSFVKRRLAMTRKCLRRIGADSFTHLAARSRDPRVRGTLYLGVYQTGSSSVSEFLTSGPTAFAARLPIHLFNQASSIRYGGRNAATVERGGLQVPDRGPSDRGIGFRSGVAVQP
jgi:hypothetical protein